jgi:Carboxypeptidase regulatory-like domain/IPT/TIG domain
MLGHRLWISALRTLRRHRVGSALRLLSAAVLLGFVLQAVGCGGGGGLSQPNIPSITDNTNNNNNNNGVAINDSNPTLLPNLGTPGGPPPLVGAPAGDPPGLATATYNLSPGWNLISFPFKSLSTISGLSYDLEGFAGQTFVSVDAVAHPEQVNCGYGYFAYCDQATTVVATGAPNDGTVQTVSLAAGWNLLGCPSATALSLNNVSLTRVGSTRTIESVSALTTSPTDTWLSTYGFTLSAGTFLPVDLSAGTDSLQPQQGLWVFTWQDVDFNYNAIAPGQTPQIASLSSSSLNVGDTLTINGSGFGSDASQGQVDIFDVTLAPTDITAWSNTQITLKIPAGVLNNPPGVANTGNVVVLINRYPSNRQQMVVNPGASGGSSNTPATGTGTLTGTVKDASSGAVLAGCQLMLDSGENTASDAAGNWTLPNLSPGQHLLFATLMGYQSGSSLVTVSANQTGVVSVTLSAATSGNGGGGSKGGGSKTGTLYVSLHGNSIVSPTDLPKRIDVQEYGNYNHHWTTGNTSGLSDPLDLTCSTGTGTTSPVLGVTYTIKLTWQSGATKTVSRTFTSDGQTETFYSP